jgi:hypothetical protein
MQTRKPTTSTDIGSVIQSETSGTGTLRCSCRKIRRTMLRVVRGCAPISAPGTPWFQNASGLFGPLSHPPPGKDEPSRGPAHVPPKAGRRRDGDNAVGRPRVEFACRKNYVEWPRRLASRVMRPPTVLWGRRSPRSPARQAAFLRQLCLRRTLDKNYWAAPASPKRSREASIALASRCRAGRAAPHRCRMRSRSRRRRPARFGRRDARNLRARHISRAAFVLNG